MTEKEYKKQTLDLLKKHKFECWEEVWGKSFEGIKVRIDAIVKYPFKEDVFFGIEFKTYSEEKIYSLNYYMKHMKQAVDYSYSKWGKDKRRLFIFLAPNPFEVIGKKTSYCSGEVIKSDDYGILAHFLAQFNVGIVDELNRHGTSLILGGNAMHRIWSEEEGATSIGLKRNYNIKTGSQ